MIIIVCPGFSNRLHVSFFLIFIFVPVRPRSPPYRSAIFVFYYINSKHQIAPLGTAVAIDCRSKQIMLTAGHCCFADNNRKYINNLFITKSLGKDNGGCLIVPGTRFPVEILYCTKSPDIGILRRIDGLMFDRTIPLCPREEIPWIMDPENWEVKAKCYHCAIDYFLLTDGPSVSCEASEYRPIASGSEHHFSIREEFLGGSSGGAWVLPSELGSKLIGILITTASTPIVVDAITEPAKPDGSIEHSVWNPSLTVTTCIVPSTLQFHNKAGLVVYLAEYIESSGF
jgi:hypothetical protein